MKAAPRKGALWIVIAIVIAVAVTAAVMYLAVLPLLQPAQTGCVNAQTSCVKIHVTTFDVGYDQPGFNPHYDIKAGTIILIEMNNSGAMAHEFLLFSGSDHDPEFREGRPRARPKELPELERGSGQRNRGARQLYRIPRQLE